jgi:hypothetical protein
MVVAPEGPPTEDHERDEEENGTDRHGSPLDAASPMICPASGPCLVQWSNVLLSGLPRRRRRTDGTLPKSHGVVHRSYAANHVTTAPTRPHSPAQGTIDLLSRPP